MRSPLHGLTVPVLLIAAAFAVSMVPQATAETATYTITGRVLSDAGVPLEGVQVNGWTYYDDPSRSSVPYNDNDVTDAEGRFELTLGAGKGNINVYYEKWRQSDAREFLLEGDQTLDFTLKTPPPKTAIISGVVVDGSGNPIPGATVQMGYACCIAYAEPAAEPAADPAATTSPTTTPSEGDGSSGSAGTETKVAETRPAIAPYPYPYYDDWGNAVSDESGRFTIESYGGPRQITAWGKGYAQTSMQVEAKENETTEIRIVLEKVPARDAVLTGRITDERTGLPISGATVNLRSLEWGRYAYAETKDDGTFSVTTLPGWTEVSVSWYPRYDYAVDSVASDMIIAPRMETQYYPYSAVVKLESGDNDHDAELLSKPKPDVVLTGYVVDPDAKSGVEGATVHVWNQDTGDWGQAITDATGSYRILVREGHHTANAWKEGYLGGTQTFEVEGASERADITLPKGTQRYAPCDYETDECGYPYPMMAREASMAKAESDGGSTGAVTGTSAPPAAPGAQPAPDALGADESTSGITAFANAADTSRAASYSGSGGGLPPYDANAAAVETDDGSSGTGDDDAPGATAPTPGLGIVAALGVLALAAIALGRRRS